MDIRRASRRAVFLDRDGVINRVVARNCQVSSPRSLAEFEFERGIGKPIERLRAAGYRLFVVTNQPDIARGLLGAAALAAMTDQIKAALPIDDVKVCPHQDSDQCACRKPRPGMLLELAVREGLQLAASFVIGDSWKDAGAARAAGCKSIILDRPYNQKVEADFRVPDLAVAATLILETDRR
ncbi:MAG: D-glycero-alpha-D-manno-heptose-1,7-bisphosphate 7-phosphatase [Candidatus Binataceae bacterium]